MSGEGYPKKMARRIEQHALECDAVERASERARVVQ
jgi:hypothetical protein